jgi:hypothetical protein
LNPGALVVGSIGHQIDVPRCLRDFDDQHRGTINGTGFSADQR